jgi:hypothetical protein
LWRIAQPACKRLRQPNKKRNPQPNPLVVVVLRDFSATTSNTKNFEPLYLLRAKACLKQQAPKQVHQNSKYKPITQTLRGKRTRKITLIHFTMSFYKKLEISWF